MADRDSAFEQQTIDIPQRQRKSDIHQQHQTDYVRW